jgi:glutathione S-transferase
MKLYLNPPSPYARKVVVVAHEVRLAHRVDIVKIDPWGDPQALLDATPLCKVPALVTDSGDLIVESTTICEYLMDQAGEPLPSGNARSEIMARAAIAHGMMDAAFVSVIEKRRPETRQWPDWIDRQYRALARTLPILAVPPMGRFDLGDATLACTLAYLDFWVSDIDWRSLRPDLATWLDGISERPSMIASRP